MAPEFINSYEIGYKQAIGHNISIDAAAFYYDYNNLQVPISVLNGGVVQSEFINSPKAVSEGIEFEGEWSPIHNLLITASSYSYDHTALETGCTLSGGVPTAGSLCVVDTNDPDAVEPGANPAAGQAAGAARVQSVKGNPLLRSASQQAGPRCRLHLGVRSGLVHPGRARTSGATPRTAPSSIAATTTRRPRGTTSACGPCGRGRGTSTEIIGFIKNVFNNQEYEAAGTAARALPGQRRHQYRTPLPA